MANEAPRFHPAADFFPLMGGDEYDAFAEDVKRSGGIRTPVVYRTLQDGTKEYLDGRNRMSVCLQEGFDCPEREYDGDQPVEEWIVSENLQGRRQLDSSQRAVVAILARKSYMEAGRDPVSGEWGEFYSKRFATNRNYLYAVQSMLEELPHLLDEIRDGRSTVRDAQEVLRKHRQKSDQRVQDPPVDGIGEPPPGGSSPPPPESNGHSRGDRPHKDLPPVTDGKGEPVPDEYRQEFAARNLFSDVLSKLAALKESVVALVDADGSDWLDPVSTRAMVENLTGQVRAASPYSVCPNCDGSRRLLDHRDRKVRCSRSEGYGYVNQARFDGDFTIEHQHK